MPQKIFRKFGTVRSRNISDLEDLTQSLNNLLDGLVEDTINESFIGSEPIIVQDLSKKFIVEFLKNIKDQKIPNVIKNQRDLGLDFHLLDLETIKEISEN